MVTRLFVLSAWFLSATLYLDYARRPEVVPAHAPVSALPLQIGGWQGRDDKVKAEILTVLGVDEYVNRYYALGHNQTVALYIGYYQSQRQDDSIHSPLNCLPGAGWQPLRASRVDVAIPGRQAPIHINQVLIEKGIDRQLVGYWYQSHGRVVASEYTSKFWLVWDAMRLNRSDAALVRVIAPLQGEALSGLQDADAQLTRFIQDMFPTLDRHLPL
jgi:EpsI family protein